MLTNEEIKAFVTSVIEDMCVGSDVPHVMRGAAVSTIVDRWDDDQSSTWNEAVQEGRASEHGE